MELLPRLHLVELHDLERTPAWLRTLHTEGIMFMYELTDAAREYARVLSRALREVDAGAESARQHTIIDLCAGSGGPLPFVQRKLHQQGLHTRIVLTDLVPNPASFQRIKDENGRRLGARCCEIDYMSESVDATRCKERGIRTVFGAFHHLPPELARRVLQNAVDTRSPIVIFDGKRSFANVFVTPWLTTLVLLLFSPFIRASSRRRYLLRLGLTYGLPVLPFMMLWDSVVSFLRMYSREEMREMIERVDGWQTFRWTVDVEPGMIGIQFCMGIPDEASRS